MTNEFGRPIVRSGEFPQIALLSDWHCQISKLVCDFATCLAAAGWVLKFDLFAAQVPRLPAIWRQSPDAHLEPGSRWSHIATLPSHMATLAMLLCRRNVLLQNSLIRGLREETPVAVSLWRACRLPTAKWP